MHSAGLRCCNQPGPKLVCATQELSTACRPLATLSGPSALAVGTALHAPQPTLPRWKGHVKCGGHGAHGAEHHSFTGVRMGAPLTFSSTTTNLAGSVLLALRPTT